ncbi:flavin reductase [Acidisoma cladoniae]|uniref:flavin reductase n=1 Tax=Acidisoma cladoniae TaxID=3040935 RepID=UPI00254A7E8F|nr:flavin reductase [Acidisoma sp. PAMC 29798]
MSSTISDKTRQFRNALGSFATGVTIITTRSPDGRDVGVTANSFNSVSLDPPMILWSLGKNSSSLDAFMAAEHFAVHVLAMDQEALSGKFARSSDTKFDGVTVERGAGGIPLIPGCAARFQCRTAYRHEGGDHMILVGEVDEFDHDGHAPLAFHGGRYGVFVKNEAPAAVGGGAPLLGDLLAGAQSKLDARVSDDIAASGLATEEFQVLRFLAEGPHGVADLEALMGPTSETATEVMLEDLAARDLVLHTDDAVSLTDVGRAAVAALVERVSAAEAAALQALTGHEIALLRRFLARVE